MVAAALVLAGVLAFGIIRVLEPDSLPGIDENSVGLIDPDGGRITAQYSVGRSPGAVTSGGGSVWVANRIDGTVSRIDREHDQVVTIPDAQAAWAAVDRRVVDLALVVPFLNLRATTFVSKRVGNVTHHAMYFTMLDQV